jgi:hypothetical protein
MKIPPPPGFAWENYKCYTAFESLIQNFVCNRQSWLLKTPEPIDAEDALREIRERFVEGFDEGKESFDEKARAQFADASRNAKLFFIHAEYLWAMPSDPITPETKRSYALRWFSENEVRDDDDAYFAHPHIIANPGSYYQTNKYHEVRAILRILSQAFLEPKGETLEIIKSQIAGEAYRALHGTPKPLNGFPVTQFCGVHPAFLHLCDPEESEAIISRSHRESILGVFAHVIADSPEVSCPEERIKLIRERLYDAYQNSADPVWKYRWFFYTPEIKPLWIDKKGKRERIFASIQKEIQEEETAYPLEDDEGRRIEVKGSRLQRSSALVKKVKVRDDYTCQACGFEFHKQIVHVHHLDPLAERKRTKTTEDDLITLCPNCHYLAHYFLRDKKHGDSFKELPVLIDKLRKLESNLREKTSKSK